MQVNIQRNGADKQSNNRIKTLLSKSAKFEFDAETILLLTNIVGRTTLEAIDNKIHVNDQEHHYLKNEKDINKDFRDILRFERANIFTELDEDVIDDIISKISERSASFLKSTLTKRLRNPPITQSS